jgi:hypothetical protein
LRNAALVVTAVIVELNRRQERGIGEGGFRERWIGEGEMGEEEEECEGIITYLF